MAENSNKDDGVIDTFHFTSFVRRDPDNDVSTKVIIDATIYKSASCVELSVKHDCYHSWKSTDVLKSTTWKCTKCGGSVRYDKW